MNHTLIPALLSTSAAAAGALGYVITELASKNQGMPSGEALLLLTRPNVGIGLAHRGVIVSVNNFYANHLGYRPEEIAGLTIPALVAGPYTPCTPGYHDAVVPLRHRQGHIVRMRVRTFPLVTDCTDHIGIFELA